MKIKILSWNIWAGAHLEDVLEFLKTADADIIALQEVLESEGTNTAAIIAKRLGYNYRYTPGTKVLARFMPKTVREKKKFLQLGNAVLTKQEIKNSESYDLSPSESRRILRVDILAGNTTLNVFSVHLKHTHQKPSDLQEKQTDNLIKLLPGSKALVMGDFNAVPQSNTIKKTKQFLVDVENNSDTPTWPLYRKGCLICLTGSSKYKLDYIFTSKDIAALSFEVGESEGSDHLPISAIIEF